MRLNQSLESTLGLAISEFIQAVLKASNNDITKKDFAVITVVHVLVGEPAYGISAGYGEVHLTIRTWTNDHMEMLEQEIKNQINTICEAHQLRYEVEYTDVFYANENNSEATVLIKSAAKEKDFLIEEKEYPLKWGEDFGLFTQQFKGAFFGLGAGKEVPPLHNPNYDFPDKLVETGVKMFIGILEQLKMV